MPKKTKTDSYRKLLNSAIKLFVKKGYRGASVGAITKAAGLTRGALYCHFKTKEHLALEILKLFEEKFLGSMINSVETGEKTATERFKNMMRFTVRFAKEDPNLLLFMTLISAEMVGSRNRLEPHLKAVYQRWCDFITGILEEGKRTGEFKKEIDPETMARVIIGVHDGVLLQQTMNRESMDLLTYSQQFRNLITSGVRSDQGGVSHRS